MDEQDVPEDERGKRRRNNSIDAILVDLRNAFDPHSTVVRIWHEIMFGCMIYELFVLPFAITVTTASQEAALFRRPEFQLFYALELLFCGDFYIILNTGYYENGNIHRDTRKSRIKYISSLGFMLDALAIIPLSLFPILLPQGTHKAWLECNKLLRVWRIPRYFANLDDLYSKHFARLKFFRVLLMTALVSHYVACGRIAFGTASERTATDVWLPPASFQQDSIAFKYLTALFWGVGLLSGTFEGQLPRTNGEFMFNIVVAIAGFALFTYLFSTLFVISKSESSEALTAQARINQLKHLLSFHRVPDALQAQAVEYIRRYYTDAESNDREVVKLLCPSISKDIQVELLKGMVAKIPLFKGCSERFIMALTSLLEMISLPAHYTLFNAGDPGDCMYVVNSGVLHILVNGVKVRELRKESFFGEVSVFSQRPRSASVVTTSYCTLYRLSRFHTERLLEGYPAYAVLISKAVDAIVNQHNSSKATTAANPKAGPTDEFMLTTLYQLSMERPPEKVITRRLSITRAIVSQRNKKRPIIGRSKSNLNMSMARRSELSARFSQNENAQVRAPLEPPVPAPKKLSKLMRSSSTLFQRVTTGMGMLGVTRAKAFGSGSIATLDPIKGFYDKLTQQTPLQTQEVPRWWSKLLLKKCITLGSRTRQVWLVVSQCHLLYNWIFVPLQAAFPLVNHVTISFKVLDAIADLMLVADLYLNLHLLPTTAAFSADAEKASVIPAQTAAKYARSGRFTADLLCIVPYELLFSAAFPAAGDYAPLFRFPKLMRVWYATRHKKEWKAFFNVAKTLKFAITSAILIVIVHIVGCIHFSVSRIDGFGPSRDSWLPSEDLHVVRAVSSTGGPEYYMAANMEQEITVSQVRSIVMKQYFRSLNYAACTLTSLGKTVKPSSKLQYTVALTLMLFGLALIVAIVDVVQKRVTSSALEQKEFLVTRTRIQNFLHCQNTPMDIKQRVNAFLDFWWSSHRGAIAEELLNELPESIKREIMRSMCKPALQTLSLLAGVRPVLDTLEEVFVDNVKFILYGQGEIIYRQGDYASGLFFLLEGSVCMISNAGLPRSIVQGGFFGTASLHLSESSVSYAERMTATSGCILVFVSRDHLNAMHKTFPMLSMALKALEKRLEDSKLSKAQEFGLMSDRTASGALVLAKISFEDRALGYLGLESVQFDPDATSSATWELFVIFLITLQSFAVIYDICFAFVQLRSSALKEGLFVLVEICFALDMYYHSRLGYYAYGNKIMDLKAIRKRYFHSKMLVLDVIALLPLFIIKWGIPHYSSRWELLNINKLLRLVRTPKAFEALENRYLHRTLELRILKLVLCSLLLSHFFGSIWFNFASSFGFGTSSWQPMESLATASSSLQYLTSIFWAFALMSASIAGELPDSSLQCFFNVVVMISGLLLFAFVVGNLSDVIELLDTDTREFNSKLSSLRHLLAHFRLPLEIEDKLKTYFFFQRFHSITQEHILARCLPPSLLTDIRLVHLQPMIVKVAFLAGMEASVTRMLVAQFCQVLVVKDQFICRYGEDGSDMYFVFTGIVEVLVPAPTTLNRVDGRRTSFSTSLTPSQFRKNLAAAPGMGASGPIRLADLKKINELTAGSYFGENALFTFKPRSAHTRSKTSCVLYRLSRIALELVFERYPEWKKKVLKIVSIQQEQQNLRNQYMEEQQDCTPARTASVVGEQAARKMSHMDLLETAGSNRTLSFLDPRTSFRRARTNSGSSRSLRRASSHRVLSTSASSVATPVSVNRSSARLQGSQDEQLWIDVLLECTEAQSAFHVMWLHIITIGTLYMALAVPYRVSYDSLDRLTVLPIIEQVLELLCEVLFAADIWINWNMKDGVASMDLYEQRHRVAYKKERLWWDVCAAFPIDHFVSDFYISPWLSINRCIKVVNFPHYMKELNRRSVSYESSRLYTLLSLLLVCLHWCACAYFVIASIDEGASHDDDWDAWAPSTDARMKASPLLRGYFFATTQIVKKGKTFQPEGQLRYLFSLVVAFLGMILLAFMIGELANLYTSFISNKVEFRKNHIAVALYLERGKITGSLNARAHGFLSALWSSHRGVNYQTIFDEVPSSIRTESILHIAQEPLKMFVDCVFRPFSGVHSRDLEALITNIACDLKYESYPRDECVIIEGSVSKAMYFVIKGYLVANQQTTSATTATENSPPKYYHTGDFFGERGLLGYSVSSSTVRTIRACDIMSLSSEALLKAILSRPLFQTTLSIAVEAYREACKMANDGASKTPTEDEWGTVLHTVLEKRKRKWLNEELQYGSDITPEESQSGAGRFWWRTPTGQFVNTVGIMALRTPTDCVHAFSMLLRLIVSRGALTGRTPSFSGNMTEFHDNLPLMEATKQANGSLDPIKSAAPGIAARITTSVTEVSDTSNLAPRR